MNFLKRAFSAVILSIITSAVSAQTCVTTESVTTCTYNINDDGYAIVPIPFGFPYYGRTFTHSIFFDNGVVSFYTPNQYPQNLGGQQFYSETLSLNLSSQFNYSIMPLWTDLVNYSGRYFTETDGVGFLRYNWENISQWGHPDRLNTFSAEIRPSGYIGLQYQQVNIGDYPVTIGLVGNVQLGEYTQFYRQDPGGTTTTANLQNWAVNETVPTDCSNALSNPACPGYAEALFQQQCSNPLYSPACPGYSEAYFTQQCSVNALYDSNCPGYAAAYYNYQCGVNPLYHTGCTGYEDAYFTQQCSLNTLYNEACPGYDQAYFDQQCSLDPLYNNQCPLYEEAYYVQQCNINPLYDSGCTGYDVAYFDQQCSLNRLYSIDCPGYAEAYYDQQCSINSLYDSGCPGYANAFYNQQCSLDALYDNACPGYAEAYAKKYILGIGSEPTVPVTVVAVEEPATITSTAIVEEPVAVIAVVEERTVVAQVETKEAAVTASPASEATAPVSLTASSSSTATTAQAAAPAPSRTAAPAARTAPTTRQALAEQRMAAAREAAAQSARENPGETAAAIDSAASMEQQVEVQNAVLGAIGFVPGFDAYSKSIIPDAAGYRPFEIYPGQRNIDTPAARSLLGRSDRLHQDMVDSQYNKEQQ
jgi:hypothetical protein